jgi:hypothetical protein
MTKEKEEIIYDKMDNNIVDEEDDYVSVDGEEKYDMDEDDVDEFYEENTLVLIRDEFIKYFEKTFIPIGEYIDIYNIDKFLDEIDV